MIAFLQAAGIFLGLIVAANIAVFLPLGIRYWREQRGAR